jgi:hypothetical protein
MLCSIDDAKTKGVWGGKEYCACTTVTVLYRGKKERKALLLGVFASSTIYTTWFWTN